MTNTMAILNGLEFLYDDNVIISQLKKAIERFPDSETAMVDAFSLGQLKSKLWLIENLPNNLGLVFICAGWYGTLASLMFDRARKKFDKIRSFDIDNSCADVADTMNRPWVMDGWQFKASTMNIHNMSYPVEYTTYRADGSGVDLCEMPDTIINTSCEHIYNFTEWYDKIPDGKLVVLQSNNYDEIEDHINCSDSLSSFSQSTPLQTLHYEGTLELPKYERYMRIGVK